MRTLTIARIVGIRVLDAVAVMLLFARLGAFLGRQWPSATTPTFLVLSILYISFSVASAMYILGRPANALTKSLAVSPFAVLGFVAILGVSAVVDHFHPRRVAFL